jgi:hypothetical protein
MRTQREQVAAIVNCSTDIRNISRICFIFPQIFTVLNKIVIKAKVVDEMCASQHYECEDCLLFSGCVAT